MAQDLIGSRLDSLRHVAKEVNTLSDTLNAAIHAVELELHNLNLGFSPRVELLSKPLSPGSKRWLAYARSNGKWRLELHEEGPIAGLDVTPLLSASREVRQLAIDALPALLDALHGQASNALSALREATSKAESLIGTIAQRS